jgi:outer membrane protein OmpA-like peptidoglycan-associated protein
MRTTLRAVLLLPKPFLTPRATLLVGALVASPALAQTAPVKTFDIEQVSLTPGGQHSLLLSTGDVLDKGSLRLSLAAQYQHDPLVFVVGGVRQGAVIGPRLSSHLAAAYGLTDNVELALQLPVVLTQGGDDLSSQGITPVSGTVFGAPVLQGRFALARQSDSALVDVGLNAGLALPLGGSTGLARDPGAGLAFNAGAGFGREFGSFLRVGAELSAVVRQRNLLSTYKPEPIDEVGTYFSLGVSASTLGEGLRGELSARTLLALTETRSAVEVLAGARYPLPHNLEVFALAGPGFGQMPGNPLFRAFAGVSYRPFNPVRAKQALPVSPEPAPVAAVPVAPCPAPAPVVVAEAPAPVKQPEPPAPAPEPAPEPTPTPVVVQPPPPAPVENKLAVLEKGRIRIKDQVRFATSKSDILPESFPLLEEVVSILKAHPELTRLRIAGHTDNRGAHEYNINLSQDRAEAVRRFLIERGVEASRLEAKGYGPDQPIASNDDAAGRQKNRRTEFESIDE